jgi:hypothetical protein
MCSVSKENCLFLQCCEVAATGGNASVINEVMKQLVKLPACQVDRQPVCDPSGAEETSELSPLDLGGLSILQKFGMWRVQT